MLPSNDVTAFLDALTKPTLGRLTHVRRFGDGSARLTFSQLDTAAVAELARVATSARAIFSIVAFAEAEVTL